MSFAPTTPINTPISPPIIDNKKDSIKNWMRISDAFAPIAIRIPISFVRSVTDTSIMFIIPIPPTSSDTDALTPIIMPRLVSIERILFILIDKISLLLSKSLFVRVPETELVPNVRQAY